MARFVARPGLDAYIARTVGERAVNRLKDDVTAGARRRAPDGKVWTTMMDPEVRPSHRDAQGQLIPANLRYRLRRMVYMHKGRGPDGKALNPAGGWKLGAAGLYDLAREPRDPELPDEQRIRCRCESGTVPGAVARTIAAGRTQVQGTRVVAEVDTRFPRAAESEFGTSRDKAALFMTGGAREAAARLRARHPA